MADWLVTKPADSDLLSQFPANERAARASVVANFGVDHMEVNDAHIGKHKMVTARVLGADPTAGAGEGVFYAKDVAGTSAPFFRASDGTVIALGGGGGGDVALNGDNTFTGNNTFTESITMLGELVGFRGVPLTVQDSNYTFVLADSGRGRLKATTSAVAYTVPANATVAYPVGTLLAAVNGAGSGLLTLLGAANVTLRLAGTTTTGTRTVAVWGWATLLKISTDSWLVSGPGAS